jgi:hypothetical protein
VELTEQANQIIEQAQSSGQTHESIMMIVMAVCLVVILIALGWDFWRNVYNMIFFPRVTFMRLAGEQQFLPNLFVVLFFGIVSAMISVHYWTIDLVRAGYLEQIEGYLTKILEYLPELPGADMKTMIDEFMKEAQSDINTNLAGFAIIPVTMTLNWLLYGLGFFITGKLIAKSTGGYSNYLCGNAFFYMFTPLIALGDFLGYMPNLTMFGNILFAAASAAIVLYAIFCLRDYWHCSWVNAIIGVVILVPLFTIIFSLIFTFLLVMLIGLIAQYV